MTSSLILKHAHATQAQCESSLSALFRRLYATMTKIIGERRVYVTIIHVHPSSTTVEVTIDGQLHVMSVLAVADLLGPDGPAVMGRWCQLLINGATPDEIIRQYPDWFVR